MKYVCSIYNAYLGGWWLVHAFKTMRFYDVKFEWWNYFPLGLWVVEPFSSRKRPLGRKIPPKIRWPKCTLRARAPRGALRVARCARWTALKCVAMAQIQSAPPLASPDCGWSPAPCISDYVPFDEFPTFTRLTHRSSAA